MYPEPSSPWRNVSLEQMAIPNEAKMGAQSIKPVEFLLPLYTNTENAMKIFMTTTETPAKSRRFTFLFLHSAAFTASDWQDWGTLPLLAALGYKSFATDLPGNAILLIKTSQSLNIKILLDRVRKFAPKIRAANVNILNAKFFGKNLTIFYFAKKVHKHQRVHV